jgi:hypothetical protein
MKESALENADVRKLILVPSLITLAVTLLRLTGELLHWSKALFNPAPGGGGAIVGIAWLVPVFGIYFGLKLARAGLAAPTGPAIGFALLGLLIMPIGGFTAVTLGMSQQSLWLLGVFVVLSIAGAVIAYRGWPALGRVLLAYGLAARIPVALVMLAAMLGSWGTHYDLPPPDFPAMSPIAKWVVIGLVPQMTIWIWFTIAVGALVGAIAAAVTGRARRPATA